MIKDFETERPKTTTVDTGILYADAVNLNRLAKRYDRLSREAKRQGVHAELAPFYDAVTAALRAAESELLTFRKSILDGTL